MTKPDFLDLQTQADNERADKLLVPFVALIDTTAEISGGSPGVYRLNVGINLLTTMVTGFSDTDVEFSPDDLADMVRGAAQSVIDYSKGEDEE